MAPNFVHIFSSFIYIIYLLPFLKLLNNVIF